jgi:ribosomal protein S19
MLYVTNNNLISKNKIKYYSTHVWRLIYLINSNKLYTNVLKKVYNSSTTIPYLFVGYEILVYSGLKWLLRNISRWKVGLKFGVLVWNRKIALYKSKQLKKIKNK